MVGSAWFGCLSENYICKDSHLRKGSAVSQNEERISSSFATFLFEAVKQHLMNLASHSLPLHICFPPLWLSTARSHVDFPEVSDWSCAWSWLVFNHYPAPVSVSLYLCWAVRWLCLCWTSCQGDTARGGSSPHSVGTVNPFHHWHGIKGNKWLILANNSLLTMRESIVWKG